MLHETHSDQGNQVRDKRSSEGAHSTPPMRQERQVGVGNRAEKDTQQLCAKAPTVLSIYRIYTVNTVYVYV